MRGNPSQFHRRKSAPFLPASSPPRWKSRREAAPLRPWPKPRPAPRADDARQRKPRTAAGLDGAAGTGTRPPASSPGGGRHRGPQGRETAYRRSAARLYPPPLPARTGGGAGALHQRLQTGDPFSQRADVRAKVVPQTAYLLLDIGPKIAYPLLDIGPEIAYPPSGHRSGDRRFPRWTSVRSSPICCCRLTIWKTSSTAKPSTGAPGPHGATGRDGGRRLRRALSTLPNGRSVLPARRCRCDRSSLRPPISFWTSVRRSPISRWRSVRSSPICCCRLTIWKTRQHREPQHRRPRPHGVFPPGDRSRRCLSAHRASVGCGRRRGNRSGRRILGR